MGSKYSEEWEEEAEGLCLLKGVKEHVHENMRKNIE